MNNIWESKPTEPATDSVTQSTNITEEKTPADLELEQLDTGSNTSKETDLKKIITGKFNEQWHFEKNTSFIYKFPIFKDALICAIATHEFGNDKYEKYSWQNNPEESYATTSINFDALCRHLNLFMTKSDKTSTDESGMNHMVHVAGRCHMLITNFYREHLFEHDTCPKQIDVRPVMDEIRKNIGYEKNHTLFNGQSDQLSSEIKLSILKCPDTFIDFIEIETNIDVEAKKEALLKLADELCCQIAYTFDSMDLIPELYEHRLDKVILDIDYLFYYIAAYIYLSPEIVESAKKWYKDETKESQEK